jgi:hypothetical protein
MIANVFWLYSVPFAIFQRAFPLLVSFVVLCEAGIISATRVPGRRSLICSTIANILSYVVGFLLVMMARGTLLPDDSSTFMLQSHLWRGIFIAFILSVFIESLVYRWMIRDFSFRRLLLLAFAANFVSYSVTIGFNWDALRNVTRQMRAFPTESAPPNNQDLPDIPNHTN